MGRSYSLDLRKRVVSRVDGGRSRRGAAADLQVSPSFSVKLIARHRRTGTLEPQRQGRPPGTGKLSSYRDFLIGRVKRKARHHHARARRRAGGAAWRRG